MDLPSLRQPRIQQFIRNHERDDPYQLSLRAHRHPGLPMPAIVEQIRARQQAQSKLPDWYATEGVVFPPPLSMEQCSSQVAAQYKQRLVQGQRLVDLTGGAGVDTYYLSQSFARADYVEQKPPLTEIAQHNFRMLGTDRIRTHTTSAGAFLSALDVPVDCIYLDPARRDVQAKRVFQLADSQPNVLDLRDTLLAKAEMILLKTAPLLDIQATVSALEHVAQVHVVAVSSEVKEVLYLLSRQQTDEPEIVTVNLRPGAEEHFSFYRSQEAKTEVTHSEPLGYLYEPNAALMKAGAFKLVAHRFGLHKLHPNTHLYTSNEPVPDFPGRTFRCQAVVPYQKKAVRQQLREAKANVATRNFPDSVAAARKKLGLQDGGEFYLFAVRLFSEKLAIIITQKQ